MSTRHTHELTKDARRTPAPSHATAARMDSSRTFRLVTPQTVHLVGIAGAGLKSLARLLREHDWDVTGSDQALSERDRASLHAMGVCGAAGHDTARLPNACDLLIFSAAVPPHNVEREAAERAGIPQFSLHEFLGLIMTGYEGVSVIGTHGKSTTTALLGHLLEQAGRAPLVFCGADRRAVPASSRRLRCTRDGAQRERSQGVRSGPTPAPAVRDREL